MADKKVTTSLCELPTEIQHLIVLNLHPSAAIALKRTNRWFHTHISLHRLGRPEVFRFLTEHENLPKFSKNFHQGKRTSSLGYACFTCLTIKPATNFTEDQITGHYGKYARFRRDAGSIEFNSALLYRLLSDEESFLPRASAKDGRWGNPQPLLSSMPKFASIFLR